MLGDPKSSISSLKMTPVSSEANFAPKLCWNKINQHNQQKFKKKNRKMKNY